MSYYPPAGSHHTTGFPYPNTPIPSAQYLTPQPQPQQLAPNVIYVPSRSGSRHSHNSQGSRHDNHYDNSDHHRDRDHHDHRHRNHRSRSRSRHRHEERHRDRDDRREKKERKRHRSRHRDRKRDHHSPQVIIQQPGAPMPVPAHHGANIVQHSVGYAGAPYYPAPPTWGQRLRQFFGMAPNSSQYRYKSDTHSWGFLGRSKRPRYVDPRTGHEVDRHGRPVYRV